MTRSEQSLGKDRGDECYGQVKQQETSNEDHNADAEPTTSTEHFEARFADARLEDRNAISKNSAMRFHDRNLQLEKKIEGWLQSWLDHHVLLDFPVLPAYLFTYDQIIELARPSLPCERNAIRKILEKGSEVDRKSGREPAVDEMGEDADRLVTFIMEEKVRLSRLSPGRTFY